ncbi:hypothetical protein E2C01_070629 [Portunus trituberculatus]|uniref:Uncharacterized protein n=1 Tax=Portunus trituberculatus TaxID=210409 RepID=A0A5B7HXT0_PORTR|nr:hypothetical protein [Portunus trituberculatus]
MEAEVDRQQSKKNHRFGRSSDRHTHHQPSTSPCRHSCCCHHYSKPGSCVCPPSPCYNKVGN